MAAGGGSGWRSVALRALAIVAVLAALAGVAIAAFLFAFQAERRSTEVRVPELIGLTRDEAERRAAEAGLVVEVVEERHDPTQSSGRVLAQEPEGGSSVRRGRSVDLVMSLGGEVLTVPDLVGRVERTVTAELSRAGFALGHLSRVYARGAPAGTILAQVPAAGSPAVAGVRVHRLVSAGPPPARWVMPDLTGLPRAQVETWLAASGFRLAPVRRVPSELPAGTVVGQSPLAGHPVLSRGVVEISVSQGGS